MDWENKNVLVAGATHFVCSHLVEKLVSLGSNVKAFIRYDYQNNWGSLDKLPVHIKNRIEVISGSLENPDAIDYATENTDIVFNLGVLDMMPTSTNLREYLNKNVMGTLNVLNAVKKYGVQKLVHISTAEVYGKAERIPISEDSPLKAQFPHTSADIGAEKLVEGYYSTYKLPVAIARVFNPYGPVQARDAIVPTIIAQGLVGRRMLLGNMNSIRDFIYVDDVIDGLIKIAECPETSGEATNLGSGRGISVGDLAEKIMTLIGRDVEILFDATRIRLQNSDIERLVADIGKAANLIGWQPETSLDIGLQKTIDWFSERTGLDQTIRS